MWRAFLTELALDNGLAEPASPSAIAAIEAGLGQPVPLELVELLRYTNGVTGQYEDLVWPAERILHDNVLFRTNKDFAELYLPFPPLLFFGDNGGGDQFAFVCRAERPDIFVWDHEDDSRYWVANSLHDYLERAVAGSGGDWYRRL